MQCLCEIHANLIENTKEIHAKVDIIKNTAAINFLVNTVNVLLHDVCRFMWISVA